MSTVVQTTTSTQPSGGDQPPPVQQGYPQQPGYPQQAYPQQGYPQPAYPPQGGYPGGYPQAGYPAPNQPQTTVIQAPHTNSPNPSRNERYNKKAGLTTGVLQIIAGGILITLGVVIAVLGSLVQVGWNFWGSILFYIVTGILGICSKNQNKCVIIAYMVLCILSAISAGGQMIFDATAAGVANHMNWEYCANYAGYHDYTWYWDHPEKCGRQKAIIAMHSLSALTALGEMIIAIVASAYCCAGCCGTSSSSQTTVVAYAQPTGPQVTVVSAGGYPPQGYPQTAGTYPQMPGTSYPQGPPPPQAPPPAYEEPMKA